ncbi:hypothetical protein AMTRI_Chr13g118410 [Amborella trichopoda]
MEGSLPPGFRFHPTDEELITFYLARKVSDRSFRARAIADVDLNKSEPWDLPGKATMGEKEWYFFSLRDRKYPTGLRTNRATDAGYWKTTGKDKEIFNSGVLVGMKKTLVFYKGRAPKGEKTNWVMHEYRLQTKFVSRPSKDEWVVSRVFQKSSGGKKQHATNAAPCDNTAIITEPGDMGSLDSDCFSQPNENISELNRLVSSSQSFSNTNNNSHININSTSGNNPIGAQLNPNMSMNMNWLFKRDNPVQPPSLLNLNFPTSNSILRALQLNMMNSYQQVGANNGGVIAPGLATPEPTFNANPSAPMDIESLWNGL